MRKLFDAIAGSKTSLYTIDFETFYSKDYTLHALTTEEYVRDPRFKVHGMGIKKNRGPAIWLPGGDVAAYLARIDFSNAAILCHHAHFDGLILSHHYHINPVGWFDTLSMARAVLQTSKGHSLYELSKLLGLPPKGELKTLDKYD